MSDGSTDRFGSDEGRALLQRAAVPVVPASLRIGVRRAVEARLSSRGRRRAARSLILALVASLLAGSALAYGVVRMRGGARRAVPVPLPTPAAIQVTRPTAQPVAPPPTPLRWRPAPRPHRVARAVPVGVPAPVAPLDTWEWPDDPDGVAPTQPAPPRLVIRREGRPEVSLVLAGDRVVGKVRDTTVSLSLSAAQILGKLGDQNVWLWMHGREAEGYVGGAPVRFELADTTPGQALREGLVLHGRLPSQTTRIATSATELSWSPGCGTSLAETQPGIYEGRCVRGNHAQVSIPESWQRLPPLTRLILLSFFLTERDPRLLPLFR